jgi:hypothetical protein
MLMMKFSWRRLMMRAMLSLKMMACHTDRGGILTELDKAR